VSVVRINGDMRRAQSCSPSGVVTIVSAMRAKWVHGISVNDKRFSRVAPHDRHKRKILAIFSSFPSVVLAHYYFLLTVEVRDAPAQDATADSALREIP
jgi:hypothetical protein